MGNVENLIETIRTYNNGSLMVPLFLVSLIFILAKITNTGRRRLVLLVLFGTVFVFNDISRNIIGKLTSIDTYYRFLWAVPVLVVIACVLVQCWFTIKEKRFRVVMAVLLGALFLGMGNGTYLKGENLHWPINVRKTDATVTDICKMIENNKEKAEPNVAFDSNLRMKVRSYDASVRCSIKRDVYLNIIQSGYGQADERYRSEELIVQVVNSGIQVDAKSLADALEEKKIDYMIINSQYGMDEYLAGIGWYAIDSAAGYTMYGK